MRRYKKDNRKLKTKKEDSNSSYWGKQCDKIWSKLIRRNCLCEICGATENLNAHHLIPWENSSTRHFIWNGVCLCPRCHKYSKHCSAHLAPVMFINWLMNNRPAQYDKVIKYSQKLINGYKNETTYKERYQMLCKRNGNVNKN